MVPNLSKGAGIKGTALYVLHDVRDEGERAIGVALTPEQQSRHRVGMTATRNLSTDNPELAWRLMCATVANRDALKQAAGIRACGRQTKNFCGHIALSWEHETKPDRLEMLRAADGALTALGWENCQALIVEHRDHDHAHCHIVVNLIDPETGRTAPNSKNDYETLQRWAHEYDKARGIEACPNRAERMERAPDDPTPPEPAKRWLSRKEFEAIRDAERAEHRAAALSRYQEAAAEVRERFRPEWAALYKAQRAEQRWFDKDHRTTLRQLDQAMQMRRALAPAPDRQFARATGADRQNGLAAFANRHRADIWRGLEGQARPGSNAVLLSPTVIRRALERVQEQDRAALIERQQAAKAELQARHTNARQDAYRAAWQRPAPTEGAPAPTGSIPAPATQERARIGMAAVLAASAAGIAAYAISRGQKPVTGRDPQRDLDQAAGRIARQSTRVANTNRPQPEREPQTPIQPKESATAQPLNELDELRAKADARNAAIRQSHAEAAARAIERQHHRDRRRD